MPTGIDYSYYHERCPTYEPCREFDMNKPITSRFRYTLRTLAIIITAICCFLGFAVWFIRIVHEKNEQDRIRFALEAERQRIETLLKSITEIKFDSNRLVTETSLQKDKASGKSESVLTAPAKQDDFFGRWKCVDDSGELVLQLWEGKAADWGYNGKLFLTLPGATGAQGILLFAPGNGDGSAIGYASPVPRLEQGT